MKRLFLAPLINASGNFISLNLPYYKVERWAKSKIINTISALEDVPDHHIETNLEGNFCIHRSRNYSYVLTGEFDFDDDFSEHFQQELYYRKKLTEIVHKMRLFKEGHIDFEAVYFYSIEKTHLELHGSIGQSRQVADNRYFISPKSVKTLNRFIFEFSIPSDLLYIKLAHDSFQESYEVPLHLSFLCLMISVEILFIGNQELVYRISRGVAILLGKSKKDSERIFTLVKNMYKKRSKLVHEGKVTEITEKDVYDLRQIVRECIIKLSKLNLNKEKLDNLLTRSGFGQFNS